MKLLVSKYLYFKIIANKGGGKKFFFFFKWPNTFFHFEQLGMLSHKT